MKRPLSGSFQRWRRGGGLKSNEIKDQRKLERERQENEVLRARTEKQQAKGKGQRAAGEGDEAADPHLARLVKLCPQPRDCACDCDPITTCPLHVLAASCTRSIHRAA